MNGTDYTPTMPQTSSTSRPGSYDREEHKEHLTSRYGIAEVEAEGPECARCGDTGMLVLRCGGGEFCSCIDRRLTGMDDGA